MAPGRQQLPASWSVYETGGRQHSSDSGLSITFDNHDRHPRRTTDEALLHHETSHSNSHDEHHPDQHLRHRRSSLNQRVAALRAAGGVNSIDNFARSWQRAAGFYEIAPVRQSFRYAADDDGDAGDEGDQAYEREALDPSPVSHRSLLRAQLANEQRRSPDEALEDDDLPTSSLYPRAHADNDPASREQQPLLGKRPSNIHDERTFSIEPSLASPFGGSYGSTWGSLASRVNEPSMRHAGKLFREQQMKGVSEPDQEREPLLVKQIQEDDGKVVNVVVGQSTLPQTIFNSVNVLVGVGLLALPLAIRYAGWLPGMIFLLFAAVSTSYTAKILAKCADVDSSLITFADLAYVSFGPSARIGTSLIFSVELIGACVALVVLFADSLNALIPGWGLMEWKITCGVVLLPLAFVPLRWLSFTSILGILSCFGIVLAVFIDGLIKPTQPGSLLQPATTHLFPANPATLPISFGLLMSPWGGHSVFPNIYRDMRHPYKYRRAVDITYVFTYLLDLLMAVVGLLMFGDGVADEITKNIVNPASGFPQSISIFVVVCVAIIPITKIPLNARPIISTLELSLGLDARAIPASSSLAGMSPFTRGLLKLLIRVLCTVIFVILAIVVPDFDRIMSLLGSIACFTICIILPCGFHLKLFGKQLRPWQKALDWSLLVVSSLLALVSTAFNFVPKDKLGL